MDQLVSLIVPVYNVEEHLSACVESILKQSYENLQIILVDDGSTDLSSTICDEYARKDDRVKVVHKKNGGLSSARNAGLDIATGKFVAFIDSDDFISNNFVSTMALHMEEKDDRIACVGFREFEDEKNINYEVMSADKLFRNTKVTIYDSFQAVRSLFDNNGICNYAWNKMYPLRLFDDIRFPEGRKMEDLGTTYLLFEKCRDVVYTSVPLYWYRQRSNSILHSPDKKFYIDKYELAKLRYLNLAKTYGNFDENLDFMYYTIFECHRYLSPLEQKWAETELGFILKKRHFGFKEAVKYNVLKNNKQLFYFLQGKN